MATEIIWSKEARDQYKKIIDYWNDRNQSQKYTNRIHRNLLENLGLIGSFPLIGKQTSISGIRGKVFMNHFTIIYEPKESSINVLNIWDNRRDPDSNKYL